MDMVTQLFQRVDTIAVSAIEVIYDFDRDRAASRLHRRFDGLHRILGL